MRSHLTSRFQHNDPIVAIANRAMVLAEQHGVKTNAFTWMMDIEACHASNPLDLEGLAKADDFNFIHDVFGIRRHLNRSTGKLEDCFSPRFTKVG